MRCMHPRPSSAAARVIPTAKIMSVKLYFRNGPAEDEKPVVVNRDGLPKKWCVPFNSSPAGHPPEPKTAVYKLAEPHDGVMAGEYIWKETIDGVRQNRV